MRKSYILAISLALIVLCLGVYTGLIVNQKRIDYSNLPLESSLVFQQEETGNPIAEYMTTEPNYKLILNDVNESYVILKFAYPPAMLSKFVFEEDGIKWTAISNASLYIVTKRPSDSPQSQISVQVYGNAFVEKVFESSHIPMLQYRRVDDFYYSLVLSLLILLIAFLYTRWNPKEKTKMANYREWIVHGTILLALSIVYILSKWIFMDMLQDIGRFNEYRILFVCALLYFFFIFFYYRKNIAKLVAFSILTIGILHLISTPLTGISWDHLTHYSKSQTASHLHTVEQSHAESLLMLYPIGTYQDLDNRWDAYERQNLAHQELQKTWNKNLTFSKCFFELPYYPAGIFLWLARTLNSSYSLHFQLGKLGNLLLYVWLSYLILQKTRNKFAIASLLCFPTLSFVAANYSYDAWTMGFAMLSLVYYLEGLKGDKCFDTKEIFIILGALFLTAAAKAAYAGIVIFYLFVPKEKFANKRHYILWYIGILIIISAIILAFTSSQYASSGYTGMTNRENNPNIKEQLAFILKNPLRYFKIWTNYILSRFITFEHSNGFSTLFGGIYIPLFKYLPQLLFIVLVFIDKQKEDEKISGLQRLLLALASMFSIFIISTAIYLDYTSVGKDTIEGVQSRYWLPVLFPLVYAASSPKIVNGYHPTKLSLLSVGIPTLVSLIGLWELLIGILYY